VEESIEGHGESEEGGPRAGITDNSAERI
jgi:hypothetical protein